MHRLALRRSHHHAQAVVVPVDLGDDHALVPLENAEVDRLAGLFVQLDQILLVKVEDLVLHGYHLADAVELPAQPVAVGLLIFLHIAVVLQRIQQAVDGALSHVQLPAELADPNTSVAGFLGKKIDDLDCLDNRLYRIFRRVYRVHSIVLQS